MEPFDEAVERDYRTKYQNLISDKLPLGSPPTHICYVNFTGFRANWGCQATSWELFKFISACLPHDIFPAVSFVPLLPVSALELGLDDHLDTVYSAFAAVAENRHNRYSALAYLERLCLSRYGNWINEVKAADLIVFQAEGTMSGRKEFRTGPGLFLLPFVAKHAWGKRVISINQTIYFTDQKMKEMVAHALGSFDLVAVREPTAAHYANSAGVDALRIPDMAFLTKPCSDARLPSLNPTRRYFAVTGTALKEPERHRSIFAIAAAIRDKTNLLPLFVAASDSGLVQLARRNWASDDYAVASPTLPYQAVAFLIQKCAFLLGGRYHMGILAATVGTPLVLLRGNTPKNEGLASMLSWPFPVRGIQESAALISDACEIFAHEDLYRQRLEKAAQMIEGDLSAAKRMIGKFLTEGMCERFASSMPMLASPSEQYYAEVAGRFPPKVGKEEGPTSTPTLSDIVERLLAGSTGDPRGTRRAIQKILVSGWEARVSSAQRKHLEELLVAEENALNRVDNAF